MKHFFFPALLAVGLATAAPVLTIPGGDPAAWRLTTFAAGLHFPLGMVALGDGSLIAATTVPAGAGSFTAYFHGAGQLIRLQDANLDGVADGAGSVVAALPGAITGLARAGDLLVVTTTTEGGTALQSSTLHVLRPGAGGSYDSASQVTLALPTAYNNIALATAPAGGGSTSVYFHLPGGHEGQQGGLVTATGALSQTLAAGSVYRLTLAADGSVSGPAELILNGIRNTAGLLVDPVTGDLVFTDNGYDIGGVPHSADELNRLPAAQIGGAVEFFGYADNYVRNDGVVVGGAGLAPLAAFTQAGGAALRVGASGLARSPAGFPGSLSNGYFLGFHGNFYAAGTANAWNPVVFYDPATGQWFDFIAAGQAGMGHIDSLLAAGGSLYLADFSATGAFDPGSGVIYQLTAVPEPVSLMTMLPALAWAWVRRRSRTTPAASGPAISQAGDGSGVKR